METLTVDTMKAGGHYNWVHQPDLKLIFKGANRDRSGVWYQFERVGQPHAVYCEVRASDLHMFEVTKS